MKSMDLSEFKVDRQHLEAALEHEKKNISDAQAACLRIEGGITYNKQCVTFLEQKGKSDVPEPE